MGGIPWNVRCHACGSHPSLHSIDSLLEAINLSLSTYEPSSSLSVWNHGDSILLEDPHLRRILQASRGVFRSTQGAFDPTIGALTSYRGFGPDLQLEGEPEGGPEGEPEGEGKEVSVESLLEGVGFEKVRFDSLVAVKPRGVQMDFNAIAKGYAVDRVCEHMEAGGTKNFLVEIGGEVRTKGVNDMGVAWRVGIENPGSSVPGEAPPLAIVKLRDEAMATSGNYRNSYQENGIRRTHIMDPKTGNSTGDLIASVSVIASDCTSADAFATAFMVMGLERSVEFAERTDGLEAVFFVECDGGFEPVVTRSLGKQLQLLP